jgi:hypothetical protein
MLQIISQITGVVDDSMAKTLAASAEAAKQFEVTADSELRSKVVGAVHKLQTGLLERETEVRQPAPMSFLYPTAVLLDVMDCCWPCNLATLHG